MSLNRPASSPKAQVGAVGAVGAVADGEVDKLTLEEAKTTDVTGLLQDTDASKEVTDDAHQHSLPSHTASSPQVGAVADGAVGKLKVEEAKATDVTGNLQDTDASKEVTDDAHQHSLPSPPPSPPAEEDMEEGDDDVQPIANVVEHTEPLPKGDASQQQGNTATADHQQDPLLLTEGTSYYFNQTAEQQQQYLVEQQPLAAHGYKVGDAVPIPGYPLGTFVIGGWSGPEVWYVHTGTQQSYWAKQLWDQVRNDNSRIPTIAAYRQ